MIPAGRAVRLPASDKFPVPIGADDHIITIRKCNLQRKRLHAEGDASVLNIHQAVKLLAPSNTKVARLNVLKLKTGHFIGIKSRDLSNFVIVNPTSDGDIRWLLRKNPEIEFDIKDVYLVESVDIKRNAIDLPMESLGG